MTKREDGGFTFTATPEDFPKKHKAPIINIGIADTGKGSLLGGIYSSPESVPES
jgi:hypothetical protein